MIQIHDLSKQYGDNPVLNQVSLSVQPGLFTALIGPNGAGKSTLLSIISRLLPKDGGQLYIKGQEIETWDSGALAQELSMLKQRIDHQAKLTVEELVSFGRYPYSKGRLTAEDREKIERALVYMELEQFRQRRIDQLSGGQLQRVHIAMILAQDTDIILLDEPLNNLDIKQGILMMRILRRLVDELGKTVLIVIHDINVASQFVDYMIAFKDGQLFCQGSPAEVMTEPVLDSLYEMDLTIADVNGKKICLYHT